MTISWVKKPEHVSQLWLPLGQNQDLTAWGNCQSRSFDVPEWRTESGRSHPD
jgi:hypothetical protein